MHFRICICLIILFCVGYLYGDFRQEQAKVRVCNPKYIKDCIVFTGRKSRKDKVYRTNMTGTLLVPFGNNVSFALTFTMKSGGDFRIVAKACDTVKSKWSREFMQQFTNIPLSRCPFPPGTYKYTNMELPPKNIPIPLADGDYYLRMELFITATKEPIVDILTLLHFDDSKPRKG
ncbi:uncharacterized protein LOC115445963 [Manduca sexta]|uniref:MD-2-related lipid-recognition domain-containing protein n=1 Tax=Manduca sexta TaxID=7130 RepID=A0A921ZAC3_MANSE|nr:uncharacterized protein LOC115445963 [Manduca sexta]KAG6453968.1 hypothetical protein O3G_MSEX008429 [Manduca sexta]